MSAVGPRFGARYGRRPRIHERNSRDFKYGYDRTSERPDRRRDAVKPVDMYREAAPPHRRSAIAAPNPQLPSRGIVQNLINSCIEEIRAEQVEETSLRRTRARLDTEEQINNQSFSGSLGIVEFMGTLVCHPLIDDLVKQNQQTIRKSKNKGFLAVPKSQVSIPTFYRAELKMIERVSDVLPGMFVSVNRRKQVVLEKSFALLKRYREIASLWCESCVVIDCFNVVHHDDEKDLEWGLEQRYGPTMHLEKAAARGACASDVPMYLDSVDKLAYCFRDENKIVEDPVYEHRMFRKRLSWTTEEQDIFVEQWARHPKDFRRIAQFLPQKTVGDCIEFYYLIKNTIHLVSKKRSRKKVVAEGKVES